MKIINIIAEYEYYGVLFQADNDCLIVNAPKGILSQDQLGFIRDHKEEIINELERRKQISCFAESVVNHIQTWSNIRRNQFWSLVKEYQNPNRGFGITANNRSKIEAILKAFFDLYPIVEEWTENKQFKIYKEKSALIDHGFDESNAIRILLNSIDKQIT